MDASTPTRRIARPSKSPYAGPLITLHIGPDATPYYVPRVFLPPTLLPCHEWIDTHAHSPEVSLPDLDDDTAHTLLHFLHTGTWQTLAAPSSRESGGDDEAVVEVARALATYMAAVRYEIPELGVVARAQALSWGQHLDVFQAVGVLEGVLCRCDEAWLHEWVRAKLRAAFEAEHVRFAHMDVFDFVRDQVLFRALMKCLVKLLSEKIAHLATKDEVEPPTPAGEIATEPPTPVGELYLDEDSIVAAITDAPSVPRKPEASAVSYGAWDARADNGKLDVEALDAALQQQQQQAAEESRTDTDTERGGCFASVTERRKKGKKKVVFHEPEGDSTEAEKDRARVLADEAKALADEKRRAREYDEEARIEAERQERRVRDEAEFARLKEEEAELLRVEEEAERVRLEAENASAKLDQEATEASAVVAEEGLTLEGDAEPAQPEEPVQPEQQQEPEVVTQDEAVPEPEAVSQLESESVQEPEAAQEPAQEPAQESAQQPETVQEPESQPEAADSASAANPFAGLTFKEKRKLAKKLKKEAAAEKEATEPTQFQPQTTNTPAPPAPEGQQEQSAPHENKFEGLNRLQKLMLLKKMVSGKKARENDLRIAVSDAALTHQGEPMEEIFEALSRSQKRILLTELIEKEMSEMEDEVSAGPKEDDITAVAQHSFPEAADTQALNAAQTRKHRLAYLRDRTADPHTSPQRLTSLFNTASHLEHDEDLANLPVTHDTLTDLLAALDTLIHKEDWVDHDGAYPTPELSQEDADDADDVDDLPSTQPSKKKKSKKNSLNSAANNTTTSSPSSTVLVPSVLAAAAATSSPSSPQGSKKNRKNSQIPPAPSPPLSIDGRAGAGVGIETGSGAPSWSEAMAAEDEAATTNAGFGVGLGFGSGERKMQKKKKGGAKKGQGFSGPTPVFW